MVTTNVENRYVALRTTRFFIAVASVLEVLTLGCNKPDSNPFSAAVTTELEGRWSGSSVDYGLSGALVMVFMGNNLSFYQNGTVAYTGTISLNTSVYPKQIDCLISSCAGGCPYVGTTSKAIYKFNQTNDTLVFAGGQPGVDERPTNFNTGYGRVVMKFVKN
jgi:uncharacterized protein (TIGR03067 family)